MRGLRHTPARMRRTECSMERWRASSRGTPYFVSTTDTSQRTLSESRSGCLRGSAEPLDGCQDEIVKCLFFTHRRDTRVSRHTQVRTLTEARRGRRKRGKACACVRVTKLKSAKTGLGGREAASGSVKEYAVRAGGVVGRGRRTGVLHGGGSRGGRRAQVRAAGEAAPTLLARDASRPPGHRDHE